MICKVDLNLKVGIQTSSYKTQDMTDPDPKVYYKMDYARTQNLSYDGL